MKRKTTKRIYLDHAAATPLHPRAYAAMRPYLMEHFGNPSAIHAEGAAAARGVAEARRRLASHFQVPANALHFTGSGTEANNLALCGVVEALHEKGKPYASMEIIVSAIEHPSVLLPARALAKRGVLVRVAPVTRDGLVAVPALMQMIGARTVLLSIMHANGEVGTIQPIKEIARALRRMRRSRARLPYFHTDACQAPLWLPVTLPSLGVDLMTLDAQKIRGPKGVGLLVRGRAIPLAPQIVGGGQEGGMRSGTENTAAIVGFAAAFDEAVNNRARRNARATALRDRGIEVLLRALPGASLNGSRTKRLPNNINITVPGLDGELMVLALDSDGIAASTKSACESEPGPSHVLRAMGVRPRDATSSIRLTFGDDAPPNFAHRTARALVGLRERQERALRRRAP